MPYGCPGLQLGLRYDSHVNPGTRVKKKVIQPKFALACL